MNSPIELAEKLAEALDGEDYLAAASVMADRVEYTIGDKHVSGADAVIDGGGPQTWAYDRSGRIRSGLSRAVTKWVAAPSGPEITATAIYVRYLDRETWSSADPASGISGSFRRVARIRQSRRR